MIQDRDIKQLEELGVSVQQIEAQLAHFKNGMPYTNIVAPAILGKGILEMDAKQRTKYIDAYHLHRNDKHISKFVPASGAASRMFQFIYDFIEYADPQSSVEAILADPPNDEIYRFFSQLESFAFYPQLLENLAARNLKKNALNIAKTLVFPDGCNFGQMPKAVLPFHTETLGVRTPLKAQIEEGIDYAVNDKGVHLHFTISQEHETYFEKELEKVRMQLGTDAPTVVVDFSYQKKHTDTLAVDLQNKPLRNEKGELVFRPGGHGALIENLNEIEADWVFIKNIDNVSKKQWVNKTAAWKKALAGLLQEVESCFFSIQKQLEQEVDIKQLEEFEAKIKSFGFQLQSNKEASLSERVAFLNKFLYRPIRICGMVKNEGAPGGGPFWMQQEDGLLRLQIVEMAQLNQEDAAQMELVRQSTHFNPVDLVCGLKDYKGRAYDLREFVNPNQGFIVVKNKNGVQVKGLELPGLWNGAMAYWNSLFVAVPIETFNPVKTVNDLLKRGHSNLDDNAWGS
ncbi:MAG: DUF4301 family protein [Flavobacteriaceae bacterium]|nr:DUF4301 family protein [Flavobacteriaceae bacterium]